jgi:hypothetical protein
VGATGKAIAVRHHDRSHVSEVSAIAPIHHRIDPLPTAGVDAGSSFSRVVWGDLLGDETWRAWVDIADRLESGPVELGDDRGLRHALAQLQRHGLARRLGPGHWGVRDRCPQPEPRRLDKQAAVAHYERIAARARTARLAREGGRAGGPIGPVGPVGVAGLGASPAGAAASVVDLRVRRRLAG